MRLLYVGHHPYSGLLSPVADLYVGHATQQARPPHSSAGATSRCVGSNKLRKEAGRSGVHQRNLKVSVFFYLQFKLSLCVR